MEEQPKKAYKIKSSTNSAWTIFSKPAGKSKKRAEVVFNEDSRKEFVGGFHKRKMQRRALAQGQKDAQEKQVRLEEKKQRRDQMKAFVEEMTQAQEDVEEGNVETLLDQQPRRKSKAAEAEAIKTYETETQKITAVVEDDDEDYSDMPPLAPAPPPKGSQKKTIDPSKKRKRDNRTIEFGKGGTSKVTYHHNTGLKKKRPVGSGSGGGHKSGGHKSGGHKGGHKSGGNKSGGHPNKKPKFNKR